MNWINITCTIAFIAFAIIQFVMGYRINHLYWKDIYRTTKRPSLKILKNAFENAKDSEDKEYVRATIHLYYLQLIFLFVFILLFILQIAKHK
jgi:TRAP-type C4-dicarboxylate transport system permease small subunit